MSVSKKPGDNRGKLYLSYGGEVFLALYRVDWKLERIPVMAGLVLDRPKWRLPNRAPKMVRRQLERFVEVQEPEEWK